MGERLANDAIIYIPGLFRLSTDQNPETVGHRIAAAINYKCRTTTANFTMQIGQPEEYAPGRKAEVVSVLRSDPGSEEKQPIADIYSFDYRGTLVGDRDSRPPIVQALSIAWLLVRNSGRLLASFRRSSKTLHEKLHVLYAAFGFVLIAIYMMFLIVATVTAARDALRAYNPSRVAPSSDKSSLATAPADGGRVPSKSSRVMQLAVLVITALGLFNKADAKEALNRVAIEASAATRYISDRARYGPVAGELADLVDRIITRGAELGEPYKRVHVVSYSFGTLVAMDALFPSGPTAAAFQHVSSLVTIGCPFDFIRTYWSTYFDNRQCAISGDFGWFNLFARPDVLASDFVDTDGRQQGMTTAQGTITPTSAPFGPLPTLAQLSTIERLHFVGFVAHGRYWERGATHELNAFSDAVPFIFRATEVLA